MPLLVYNLKGHSPYFNLAFEEFLFVEKDKSEDEIYLIFYENNDSVILGKNLVKSKEVYIHKKLPPVIRRASGGGSVVHFHGNLNYCLIINTKVYPEFVSISQSYETILKCVARGLSRIKGNFQIKPMGISDLCIENLQGSKKISGNSQARKRNWLLHHGTILYNAKNIAKISQFLRHPPKEPEYRNSRPHTEFLVRFLPQTKKAFLVNQLIHAFSVHFSSKPQIIKISSELKKASLQYLNKILKNKFRL